jgi:hypothetical protein
MYISYHKHFRNLMKIKLHFNNTLEYMNYQTGFRITVIPTSKFKQVNCSLFTISLLVLLARTNEAFAIHS